MDRINTLKIMKKLLVLSVLLATLSCSKNSTEEAVVTANCECDRVVSKTTFNVLGTPQNPAIVYHTVYITINDCNQVQKTKTYDTTNINLVPVIGQCR